MSKFHLLVVYVIRMFSGTDRHLNSIMGGYRNDIAFFMRSIRIFPMAAADREQFTSAIVSAVNGAKLSCSDLILVFLHIYYSYVLKLNVLYSYFAFSNIILG